MVSVAVVGVGDMGSEMIPHLLAARFDVTVYDVNCKRLEAAVAQGAKLSDSPATAARGADVVLSLVMSADIQSAHLGENGIVAGLQPGAVLVIGSTTTPDIAVSTKPGHEPMFVDLTRKTTALRQYQKSIPRGAS
jgi:3-hydroxyisobutyrate dehydrogenase